MLVDFLVRMLWVSKRIKVRQYFTYGRLLSAFLNIDFLEYNSIAPSLIRSSYQPIYKVLMRSNLTTASFNFIELMPYYH